MRRTGDVTKTVISGATYQPSGGLASYVTGNNVTTTVTPDASLLSRPSRISTSGSTGGSFDTGTYTYDGAWNILAMGSDSFAYDNRSRLTSATLSGFSPQNFSYDRYGNLLSKGSTTFCTTTCTNNRLPSPWVYDARGNLTVNGSETLTYDAVNQQIRDQSGSIDWKYLYDGNRERIVKVPVSGSATFTYRDEAGHVLTEYVGTTLGRDNVFLGNLLVGTYVSSTLSGTLDWQFYASDHLGSPRLVTDPNAAVVESRKYWPYGEEATGPPTSQRLSFAAMERDVEANHYYDHARNHDFNLGRFLTPDLLSGTPYAPQSWNRYSYVLGNPVLLVDPWGLTYCGADVECGDLGGSSGSGLVIAWWAPDDGSHWWKEPWGWLGGLAGGFLGGELFSFFGGGGGNNNVGGGGATPAPQTPGLNCSSGSASTSLGQYLSGVGSAALMFGQFLTGRGPSDLTFGPGSVESQMMGSSPGVTQAINDFLSTGKPTGLYTFGFSGLVAAGTNPMKQFVGSYSYSITPANGGLNVTLSNYTSVKSGSYHRLPSHQRSSFGPMGTTHQTYQVFVPCHN